MSWRHYAHELNSYFSEWIDDLNIKTLQELKDLMITKKFKFRVPSEIRDHFLGEWIKLKTPYELAEKLDEYESLRLSFKESQRKPNFTRQRVNHGVSSRDFLTGIQINTGHNIEKTCPKEFERRLPQCYECGSYSHLRPQCDKNFEEVASISSELLWKLKK